jgi:acetylornithine deacetylase
MSVFCAMSPVLKTLASLVSINSINPEWGGPGEGAVADFVEAFFADLDVEVDRHEILTERENVMIRLQGIDSRRAVVLEAHMDTVSVDGMTIPPFDPTVEDGKMYGRGSCDTKAGLAGMMHAIRAIAESGAPPPVDVYLASVIDEEYAFRGVLGAIDWFSNRTILPEAAVVTEPTEMRLVRANKGCLRWKIETVGVSAHSSKPHLGKNAITAMAEVIGRLDEYHTSLQVRSHPLLGSPTACVGVIEGGDQVNFVPERCTISLDRRMLPGEKSDDLLEEYRRIFSDCGDCEVIVHPAEISDEAMETAESELVVKVGSDVLSGMGLNSEPCGVPFGCDVTKLSRAGTPGVIFGPGSIDQAHGAVEYVDTNEVELAFAFYRDFLLNYGA